MEAQNPWTHRTRHGKKRKTEDIEKEEPVIEVHHADETTPMIYRPSCSLMPARPLGASLDDIDIKPAIKSEAVETNENSSSTTSSIERMSISSNSAIEFMSSIEKLIEEYKNDPPVAERTSMSQSTNRIIKDEPMDTDDVPLFSLDYPSPHCPKSVPDSSVDDLNMCEATIVVHTNGEPSLRNGTNFDMSCIKSEPATQRSRSSSTETVLADESQQRPSTEKFVINDQSSTLNTYYKIGPLNGEPEASTAQLDTSLGFDASTSNSEIKSYERLLKFIKLDTEINKTEVDECLNTLNHTYLQTKCFDVFFSHIPSRKEPDDLTTSVSTADLKKIIAFSELLHLQLPSQMNGNTVSATDNISLSSVISSITSITNQSDVADRQSVISDESKSKFRIKSELLDDYETPSFASSSSNRHDASTNNKRSASEGAIDIQAIAKTITSNVSERQSVTSAETLISKFHIKTEPLDDYETPSFASNSSNCHDGSTNNKRSSSEAGADMYATPKKIKVDHVTFDHSVLSAKNEDAAKMKLPAETPIRDMSPQNMGDQNAASVAESILKSCVNSSFVCIASQSGMVENQSVASEEFVNEKIQIKTEPLDNYDTCSSDIHQQASKSSKRSACEMASDVHPMTKTVATESLLSEGDTEEPNNNTSDVSKNWPSINENFSSICNAASNAENIENSTRVSDLSSASSNKISQPIVVQPKISTYLHLVPLNVTSFENGVSGAENILQNTSKMSSSSALSTLISSGVPNTFDAINIPPCDRIDGSNNSFFSASNNEITRKKIKLTPEEYLKRKYLNTRDPRLQKSNSLNSPSQGSFTVDSASHLVQPAIISVANQQNHTVNSVSSSQSGHSDYIPKCPVEPKVHSPRKQLRQESVSFGSQPLERPLSLETISPKYTGSDTSSGNSVKSSKTTPRDPRKLKSYYQKIFEGRRGNQALSSTPMHENVGKIFFDRKDLSFLIVEWNVDWLETQQRTNLCPPICNSYPRVKDTYESVQEYYNTYLPLHLLNIWLKILDSWKISTTFYDGFVEDEDEKQNFVIISCYLIFNAEDKSNWPKKEDLLICTSTRSDNSIKKLFGRVIDIKEYEYYPSSSCSFYGRPGNWKKVCLHIVCVESFGVFHGASIQLQNLINIKLYLDQNDALKYINTGVRKVILNPRIHGSLLQVVFVDILKDDSIFKKHIENIKSSVLSSKHRITLVDTQNPQYSVSTILRVASSLARPDTILLICVKDEKLFLEIALKLKISFVLAIKDEEVSRLPPELQKFAMKNRGPETLQTIEVALTLMSSMFFGALEKEFRERHLICLILEAQYFSETETALVLQSEYNVQHLVLVGRRMRKDDMHSIQTRYGFDVSFLHRIWGRK